MNNVSLLSTCGVRFCALHYTLCPPMSAWRQMIQSWSYSTGNCIWGYNELTSAIQITALHLWYSLFLGSQDINLQTKKWRVSCKISRSGNRWSIVIFNTNWPASTSQTVFINLWIYNSWVTNPSKCRWVFHTPLPPKQRNILC